MQETTDGTPASEKATPPMGVQTTTLIVLEGLIRGLDQHLAKYIDEQREQTAKFYATRMLPLEERVMKLSIVAWFALGMASAALLVGAAAIVALILR